MLESNLYLLESTQVLQLSGTENLFEAAEFIFNPTMILIIVVVSIISILLGATPGVGPTLTMVLFFPFTLGGDPALALMVLATAYGASTYGGSISAILVNVPGTGGSSATLLDGYPMTQNRESARALGISTVASFAGAIFGLLCLILFGPKLAQLVFILSPANMFWLAILGLSVVAAVTRGSLLKGLISVSFGVWVASIGRDPTRGASRYTFDHTYLEGGVGIIIAVIGIFAISEVINLAIRDPMANDGEVPDEKNAANVWDGVRDVISDPVTTLQSALIGTTIGSIPGVGISAANFLSYLTAVARSKNPKKFGKGNPTGVLAGETANNASTMGALIPAMALGIPGGAAAAVFIGVMLAFGIAPGPSAFQNELPYIIFIAIIIGDIVFLVIGLSLAKYFARVTDLPSDVVLIGITVISLAGGFAIRNLNTDLIVILILGYVAFLMRENGYSIITWIMGFILAPIAERGFQRSLAISGGDYSILFEDIISLFLIVLSIFIFFLPIIRNIGVTDRLSRSG